MKRLSLLFFVIFTAFMLTACSEKVKNQTAGTESELKEVKQTEPVTVRLPGTDWGYPSPFLHNPRGPGFYNMFLIFDGLIEKDDRGIIPWLAKEWTISEDGKTYTFMLQKDVKWHDGKPFTAEDVKFSYEYFLKHPPVRNTLFVNKKPIIEKVEVLSPTEVAVTVNTKSATNLEKLGWTRMIPKHIWENVDDPSTFQQDEALIGTGPFRLTNYSKEQGVYRYEAFKDFWGPKQTVQVIEQVPVSDPVLAFENGELDYTAINPDLVENFKAKGFEIQQDPPFSGTRLMINMENEVLADKTVRQAIAHAINMDELVEKVLRGAGIPGHAGYLSPKNEFYNENTMKYEYNPEKAKELLGGETYTFTLKASKGGGASSLDVKLAELMKLQLAEVGITLNVIASDLATVDEAVNTGNYELLLHSLGGLGGDPDLLRELFRTKSEGQGMTTAKLYGYSNPELDQLADAQQLELDVEKRRAIIDEMQEIIAKDLPTFFVYYKTSPNVIRDDVFNGWLYMYDHHWSYHTKLTYLERE